MSNKHKLSIRDKHYISEAIVQIRHWNDLLSRRVAMVIEARNLDPGEYVVDMSEGVIKRKEVELND